MDSGILKRFHHPDEVRRLDIPPVPRDSWVVGDEPYGSLHFLGADPYTR